MQQIQIPATRDLVLIGGGHSHALVLRRWAMRPLPGARITVINPGPTAPYSGMLPGFVAGHYDRKALDIDLVRLARRAGARLILSPATGLDAERRAVLFDDRPSVAFDIASIDVGITSDMPDLPGFARHAIPAKPLGAFAEAWDRFRAGTGPARIAIIGAGVAGAELAMAMAHAMRTRGRDAQVTLIERAEAFSALPPPSARDLRAALKQQQVTLLEGAGVERIEAGAILISGGRRIEADYITGAAGARPLGWLRDCGLRMQDGFVEVDAFLRSSDPSVFAVGDCAHFTPAPLPKAGVYAVRQAPVLFDNLRASLVGQGGLRPYRPQKDYLKLVSLGGKSALGDRFGLTFSGGWVWRWKDRIDRRFMQRFHDLPAMPAPVLPWPRAAGVRAALGSKPACGGCGAKVGAPALQRALDPTGTAGPGDDAAVLHTGGARQVISTDHLRALTEDPVIMARIAAVHALGDIWAMGARPQAATASIILPRMTPELAERSLSEIMQAARAVMAQAGAEIVGGHSTLGAELTIGFTVTGLCDGAPITLSGARPGDSLLLTKPLGTGVVMAAEMQGKAHGGWVAAALDSMTRPQGDAAALLTGAHAMTDVTGFGLLGHLGNICAQSGVGAELRLGAIRLLPGALDLARNGIRSTLYPENRAAHPFWPEDPLTDLLFDPQTGGGLLAAVPGDADGLLTRLREIGCEAAIIGRITDCPGQISAV
jgi:selenide,water dikinase